MKRLLALAAALLLLVACGSGDPGSQTTGDGSEPGAASFNEPCGVGPACPVFASAETVVGQNRFLMGLINNDDAPMARPNIAMHVKFFNLNESTTEPKFEKDMHFIWTVKPVVGVYLANIDFDKAGPWGAEVTVTGKDLDTTIKQQFVVKQNSTTPALGAKVPASDTATAGDGKSLKDISTDPHPDPDFYRLSIKDALKQHKPLVVTFATPKFCETQFCGPTLDKVKAVSADFPNVNFIHSEIYKGFKPGNPVVPAVKQWGLPSEPWVFIVGEDGRLVQKYDTAFTPQELRHELEKL